MTDVRELLRTTAAKGGEAVDLAEDVVAARISRRRIRTRRYTVGGVTLAAAAVIAGTTWAVRPDNEQPPTAGGSADAPPRIVRSDSDSPTGAEALFQTTLSADANGCVRASSKTQTAVTLVWPRGYTVRGNSKSFEILDSTNKVVARSGVPLDIGGGGADDFNETWTGRDCASNGQLWLVGRISSR